jgi:hypothetical protein
MTALSPEAIVPVTLPITSTETESQYLEYCSMTFYLLGSSNPDTAGALMSSFRTLYMSTGIFLHGYDWGRAAV